MSNDGAHAGISAERALQTILGGQPAPEPEECETVEQMRERILATPIESESYDGAAMAYARLILEAWKKYPQLLEVPMEAVYLRDEQGQMVVIDDCPVTLVPDLYDALKKVYRDRPDALSVMEDLTGFMVGWAQNAALRCLDLPPVPNPAIVEIG